jgi:hypothetical protein
MALWQRDKMAKWQMATKVAKVRTECHELCNLSFSGFAPIFRSRLRDGFFTEGAANVTFECQPFGNPTPEVTFFHHESAICEDGRHRITQNGSTWRSFAYAIAHIAQ